LGQASLDILYNRNTKEFGGSFESEGTGRNFQIDYNHKHEFGPNITGLFGFYYQHLEFEEIQGGFESLSADSSKFDVAAPFVSLVYDHENGLNIHGGLRYNIHSEYGTKWVYNLNPSYRFYLSDDIRLKILSSISKSFVSPSLFQVFSFFGTRDLKPEDAINYEGGFSIYLAKRVILNSVYYRRDEDNPIDFVSEFDNSGNFIGGSYRNVSAERTVEGVEMDMSWQINEQLRLAFNYALTKSDLPSSLSRIPKHKLGVIVDYKPLHSTLISARFNHTGDRNALDFNSGSIVTLDSYQLVDLYLSHKVWNDQITLYTSINNLFDEDFIGILGFTTRGRNFTVGGKWNF